MAFDINSITANDFKVFFYRDFSYLPVWIAGKTYQKGDIAFDDKTDTFFTSLVDDNTADLDDLINWEVNTTAKLSDYILDADIEKADAMQELLARLGFTQHERFAAITQHEDATRNCGESHFQCLERTILKDGKPVLILEDDVEAEPIFIGLSRKM